MNDSDIENELDREMVERLARFARSTLSAGSARSTNSTVAAPRLSASIPTAPVPA